jgi:hypothetical protein
VEKFGTHETQNQGSQTLLKTGENREISKRQEKIENKIKKNLKKIGKKIKF